MGSAAGKRIAFSLIGFTAAVSQVVLLRELMGLFGGNEVSLGLMLASWLLWTAAGSAAGDRLARAAGSRRAVAGLQALVALALPLTICAIRASKARLETVPGESLGPAVTLAVSTATLGIFCLCSGALFAAAGRLWERDEGAGAAAAGAAVYSWEALGAAVGAVAAGLFLLSVLDPLQIAGALAAANLAAAACFVLRSARGRIAGCAVVLASTAGIWAPAGVPRIERSTIARLWPGYRLLETRHSAFGNLVVVESEGSRSLYENGLLLFHAPDPEGAEEAVHFALLEHPDPRSLLLIGGGMNGSLAQALRHPSLERVDYVELDPVILNLARRYFPREWEPAGSDPRVSAHAADGRLFLKTARSPFDVVIVNLPDPQTAQLNRYYTLEFFREAAAHMSADGILAFRLPASETYIGEDMAAFLQSVSATLGEAFSDVVAIPGQDIQFLAAKRRGLLAREAGPLLERMRERRLATAYVREYYLPYRMAPARMEALTARIAPQPGSRVNRDFAPAAYYFDVALWSSRFSRTYSRLMHSLAAVKFGWLAGGACAALAIAVAAVRLRRRNLRHRTAAAGCVFAMGFTLIGLQVLLLLSFQATYGSVYERLALLIGAFMGGMAFGSWAASAQGGQGMRALAWTQALAAAAPLALCGLLALLPRAPGAAGGFLFPILALLCGLLGGYQFPVASRVYFSSGKARGIGAVYALDLAGSCAAAVLFSAYLIPVFGFVKTALLAAEFNLAPAALAALAARDPAPD